jgi:two-component system sensor histidine kinase/response regulator
MNIPTNSQISNPQIPAQSCLRENSLANIENFLGKMKMTLEAIAEAIVWIDTEQRIEWHNCAFTKLLNLAEENLLERKLIDVLPLSLAGESLAEDAYPDVRIRQENYQPTEYELVQAESTRSLEISGNYLEDTQGKKTVILVIRDLSEAKKLEAATEAIMRRSERKYRHIFANSQVGIGRVRQKDGLFLEVNQRCAEMLGYSSAAEIIGKRYTHDFEVVPQNLSPEIMQQQQTNLLAELEKQGEIANHEVQLRRQDGSLMWGLLWRHLNVEEDCIDFVLADISERKQAEAILQEREAQYRDLVETANSIILRWDIDGYIRFINDYGQRFFGFQGSELIGRHLFDTIVPIRGVSRALLQIFISNLCQYQENYSLNENEYIRKNGERVWICWANKAIYDEHGNLIEILSVGTDTTKRKQAESSLRRSELKFRHFFENSLVGIYRHRYEDGLIVDANQKFTELLGYNSSAEVIGKIYITDICASADVRHQMIEQLHQEGEVNNFEVKFRKQDGSVRCGLYSARLNLEENYIEAVMIDITERKEAQANLSRTNALLQAQLEAVPDSILVIDEHRQIVSYNQHFCQLWQIPNELLANGSSQQLLNYVLFQVAEPEEFGSRINYLYNNFQLVSRDEIRFKDGRIFDSYSSPVASSSGNYYGRIWYFRDITERKQREESLKLIVEGTAAQIGSEFFCSCTRSLAELLQVRYVLIAEFASDRQDRARTLAFWKGEDFGENFEYELAETPCAEVLQGIRARHIDSVQTLFPKDPYLVEWDAESYIGLPITNPKGKILGILAVFDTKPLENKNLEVQDLILKIFAARAGAELERQQAETALEKQLQRVLLLKQITEDIRQSLDLQTILQTTVNQIGNIFQVDRCQIFNYEAQPIAKSSVVAEYIVPNYSPMLGIEVTIKDAACLEQVFAQEQPIAYGDVDREPTLQRSIGIYEQFNVKSLMAVRTSYQGKPNGAIVVHQCAYLRQWTEDEIELITAVAAQVGIAIAQAQLLEQEKQQRQALEEAKRSAEVANRAKSEFLANMSHELRTPLNAILGFAQLMVRDTAITPKQKEHLTIINQSGKHLLNLINDVLEMSRIEAGRTQLNPQAFDLIKLLSNLAEIFRLKAQAKRLSLQFQLADDLPQYIKTDEGKLRQVLLNLLDNAVKFTETGGVIIRVSKSLQSSSPQMEKQNSATKIVSQVLISFAIEDTGRGIAIEEQKQLFQPFAQTGKVLHNQGGTGLGLSISHHFVQLMGGTIQFTSILGQGSTFSFTIPVEIAQPQQLENSSSQQRVSRLAPGQPNYRLLVVDDCLENRELLLQLLSQVGFEVKTATNGEEAIALWQQWQPHLIWMDMRMPVMDGYEATCRIKANSTETKPIIIALTASAFAEQRAKILEAGCDDFVGKPCPEQIIFDKLAEHLGVTYLYEEESITTAATDLACLSAQDLPVMPPEWIKALNQAAIQVDADLIMQLIGEIPSNYQTLAQQLTELTSKYNFDEIIELTENSTINFR